MKPTNPRLAAGLFLVALFLSAMGRMEQTDHEISEAIYCQNVAEWHADEMNNEPPRSRRGHPDYYEIYNDVCKEEE